MILAAGQVVTLDGPVLEPGWIETAGDRLVRVESGAPPAGAGFRLDHHVLLPGLINAHCHLDYTSFHRHLTPGRSFTDWIAQMNSCKHSTTLLEFAASIHRGIELLVESGTTSVLNIESFPDLIASSHAPIRVWWAVEGIDVAAPFRFPPLPDPPAVSPHAPYTASPALYREARRLAAENGAIFTTHVGESADEQMMFANRAGPLYALMARLKRDMGDCGGRSPLDVLLDQDLLPPRAILVHLNHCSVEALRRLPAGRHFVVHCPQSHRYFSHRRFRLDAFRGNGVPVLLGTDSLASAETLSLFREMQIVRDNFPRLEPQEILAMATRLPAAALNMEGLLGVLKPGALADAIAVPATHTDPFESILRHTGPVPLVMAGGHILRQP